ncbi:MAG: diacylglycerol kinase [Spartobacteria bacterium AMD-G4]|nr:MAG: diacylglycerol kinase [Spartobacteria bacterium AMD-G4]
MLNPAARSDKAIKLRERIHALSGGVPMHLTSEAGDARQIAAQAVRDGVEVIIAAGGDGTLNEVINGIGHAPVRLGILPVGTMNVFATEIGIPLGNLEAAWKVIEQGKVISVDLPRANDTHFIQLAGVGLDAEVVRKTTADSKRALGPLSYLLTLVQVAAHKPPHILLEAEGGRLRKGSFALIGNGRLYGGPFPVFKRANLQDGLLDVLVFENQSHWDVVRYFQAIAFGTHPELPDVEYFQTSSLKVTSSGDVPVELDGEIAGMLPCVFSIESQKLLVIAP